MRAKLVFLLLAVCLCAPASLAGRLNNPAAPASTNPPASSSSVGIIDQTNPPDPAGVDFFEKKVRPVLAQSCSKCHSAQSVKIKGGLTVDNRDGLLSGGDTGPAIVPGNPDKSLLIKALRYRDEDLQMPPRQKLPDGVVDDIARWVRMGAPWPDEHAAPAAPAGPQYSANYDQLRKEHWAYQPIQHPQHPQVKDSAWPKSDLDRFILAGLECRQMRPNGPADKLTLLRRVTFDLTGLPPTPAEIEAFVADHSEGAFEKVVDRLLATPAFGERWGRHWLDVARYAESTGMTRNFPFSSAWRYRNWVVDALNADMPYNRFIACQIAGDLLPYTSGQQHDQQIIATGFLAIGPRDLNQRNRLQYIMDDVDEQVDVTTKAFLATTVSCARCHDHKFDPIPQTDYYAMAGIFRSTDTLCGYVPRGGKFDRYDEDELYHLDMRPTPRTPEDTRRLVMLQRELASAKQQLATLENQNRLAAPERPRRRFARARLVRDDRPARPTEEQRELLRQQQARVERLEALVKDAEAPTGGKALVMGVRDRRFPIDVRVYFHGEVDHPGQTVARGLPHIFPTSVAAPGRGESGRLELAAYLTSPDNPLTTRVIVNRIWQHLFGSGIVRTVDNFGTSGEKPSNPQLLDYLATRFVDDGWSIKKIIRRIVLSRAYQMSSHTSLKNMELDPDDRLCWRMAPRRLEAECIRDAILAASGSLDLSRPPDSPVAHIGHTEVRRLAQFALERESDHRSLYLPIVRNMVPEILDVFDFADPSMVMGARESTTVSTQALFMLNDPFVTQQSKLFAERLLNDRRLNDMLRVDMAYRLALGRSPVATERMRAASYIDSFARGSSRLQAWSTFCQSLLASAEFRYLN